MSKSDSYIAHCQSDKCKIQNSIWFKISKVEFIIRHLGKVSDICYGLSIGLNINDYFEYHQ